MSELPTGWDTATLGDLLDYIQPTKFIVESTEYDEDFKTPVLTAGKSFIKGYTNETEGIFTELPVIIFDDFTTATKFVDFPFKVKSSAMKILKPRHELVNIKYVFYFMQTLREQTDTHKRYWISIFSKLPIPLPPLPEQRRIVARIEALFTRLDAGVAALQQAKAQLKRYRQSVLAAAVTGELTKEWREANPEVEPAGVLLDRMLKQRREQWNGKGKYKEPIKPNVSAFTHLPDQWAAANVDSLIDGGIQNGLYLPKSKYGSGFPILRIDDFQIGWVRPLTELQRVNADDNQVLTYSLDEGDLVINRVNSLTHLGKSALIRQNNSPSLFESNMMRVRLSTEIFRPFVELYLHSEIGRTLLTRNAKWAVNQASINQTDVCSTPLPLPPLAEQHQILAKVEARTTAIDHLEAELDRQIARSKRLRQSTLTAAFCGNLISKNA